MRATRWKATQRQTSEGGVSIIEVLIATAVMTVVMGTVLTVTHSATSAWNTQPEVSDLQQRVRAGVASLQRDLAAAGTGVDVGGTSGALYDRLAPVLPYRWGAISSDAPGTYRSDVITVISVPRRPAYTRVLTTSAAAGDEKILNIPIDCGGLSHSSRCGFDAGQRVILFDTADRWDTATVTQAQDAALIVQHPAPLSIRSEDEPFATELSAHTYFLETDRETGVPHLMHYDGDRTTMPVVDNVVKLAFEYLGDPAPPQVEASGPPPRTTYGPAPPDVGTRSGTLWDDGENCTFAVVDGIHVPRLAWLDSGRMLILLRPEMLTDGPWCPDAMHPARFDADLLRVRRIRVAIRFQAAPRWLRGPASALFMVGGTAPPGRSVPDQEVRFDVAPRNLNLRRSWR